MLAQTILHTRRLGTKNSHRPKKDGVCIILYGAHSPIDNVSLLDRAKALGWADEISILGLDKAIAVLNKSSTIRNACKQDISTPSELHIPL